jgi:hypothetical protein
MENRSREKGVIRSDRNNQLIRKLRQVPERTEKRLQSVSMEAANSPPQRQCAANEARVFTEGGDFDLKQKDESEESRGGWCCGKI